MTLMFSGSRGSLRTQNDRNYLVLQVVHIVALRAQWDQKGLQWLKPTCHLCIIHIVAPVAHWGPRTLKITRFTSLDIEWPWGLNWGCRKKVNGWINIWFIYWLLWFTGDQDSLGMARYTWQ